MSEGAHPEGCDKCTQLEHTHAIATAALDSFPFDGVVIITGQGDADAWNVEGVVMGRSPTQLMHMMVEALRKTADALERAAREQDRRTSEAPS